MSSKEKEGYDLYLLILQIEDHAKETQAIHNKRQSEFNEMAKKRTELHAIFESKE